MNKKFTVLSILVIVALVLAACSSAPGVSPAVATPVPRLSAQSRATPVPRPRKFTLGLVNHRIRLPSNARFINGAKEAAAKLGWTYPL